MQLIKIRMYGNPLSHKLSLLINNGPLHARWSVNWSASLKLIGPITSALYSLTRTRHPCSNSTNHPPSLVTIMSSAKATAFCCPAVFVWFPPKHVPKVVVIRGCCQWRRRTLYRKPSLNGKQKSGAGKDEKDKMDMERGRGHHAGLAHTQHNTIDIVALVQWQPTGLPFRITTQDERQM